MPSRKPAFFIVCVICFCMGTQFLFAQEEWNSMLPEALDAWEKTRHTIESGCQVNLPVGSLAVTGKAENSIPPVQISIFGTHELYKPLSFDGKRNFYLYAMNKDYSFSLRKEQADVDYQIDNIHFNEPDYLRTHHQWHHGHLQGSMSLFDGLMIEGEWISNFIQSPNIRIDSVVHADSMVTLKFSGSHRVDKYNIVSDGSITLIPSKHWAISAYTVKMDLDHPRIKNEPATVKKSVEYQEFEGLPFPKHVKISYTLGDETNRIITQDFDVPQRIAAASDVFYLTGYGFGDIDFSQQRTTFGYFVFFIAGISLITAGLLMRYFSQKTQK